MPYLRVKNELPLIPGYSEGSIAYANDAAAAPLNECLCYINPVQSGSGDPSPSNVRPITGHTELNLVQKDGNDTVVHTYTTDLGTTVYGGTLDVETGVLTIDRAIVDLGSLSWGYTNNRFYASVPVKVYSQSDNPNIICERYKTTSYTQQGTEDLSCSSYAGYLYIKDTNYTTPADFKTAMSGIHLVYEVATPTTTQLTPQEVKSLLGSNNFYHDCNGDTKITFIRRLDS